jgi:hypothetical protein
LPVYLSELSNEVYLYEDSYIITNSIANGNNYINQKGKLKLKVTEDLITKIKNETKNIDGFPMYKIILNSGEQLTLYSNTGVIKEIENMIAFEGAIWYAK